MVWLLGLIGCGLNGTGLSTVKQPAEGVTGEIAMSLDTTEIFITDCEIGLARSGEFTLTSTGTTNLTVYSIELIGDETIFYFVEQEDLEFGPGISGTYPVSATLATAEPVDAQIRLTTDAPDSRDVRVLVHAWPVGYIPPEDTGDSGGDSGADSGADSGG